MVAKTCTCIEGYSQNTLIIASVFGCWPAVNYVYIFSQPMYSVVGQRLITFIFFTADVLGDRPAVDYVYIFHSRCTRLRASG